MGLPIQQVVFQPQHYCLLLSVFIGKCA